LQRKVDQNWVVIRFSARSAGTFDFLPHDFDDEHPLPIMKSPHHRVIPQAHGPVYGIMIGRAEKPIVETHGLASLSDHAVVFAQCVGSQHDSIRCII
jgi:hypothetical protein